MTPKMKEVIRLLPILNDIKIAEKVSLTRERVRQIRKKQNIPAPHELIHSRCSIISEEELGLLIADVLNTKKPLKELAEKYGLVSSTSVTQMMRRYGIDIRGRKYSRVKTKGLRFSKEIILETYRKFKGQKAFRQKMADALGTQHRVINAWLNKLIASGMDISLTDDRPQYLKGVNYGRYGKKGKACHDGEVSGRVPEVQGKSKKNASAKETTEDWEEIEALSDDADREMIGDDAFFVTNVGAK